MKKGALFLFFSLMFFSFGCEPAEKSTETPAEAAKEVIPNDNPKVEKDKIENPAPESPDQLKKVVLEHHITTQLKINRDALFQGSEEAIRIDAATVMLYSTEPAAKPILIEALEQCDNSLARIAVCKALSNSRTSGRSIPNKSDFIEPLFGILAGEQNLTQIKLTADAILIFDYDEIDKNFEALVTDESLGVQARVNAAYALRLQPNIKAIARLIKLMDEKDEAVVAAAKQSLHSLGIPVGTDTRAREQIIKELKRKGRDEFLRDWVIRQETQLRNLQAQLQQWHKLYLKALDDLYQYITDEPAKTKFLSETLGHSQSSVRLWAIRKVYDSRVGSTSKLPVELGPVLINLVSDDDRDVRLQTAKLLSLMVQLNSSRKLLQQLEVETDDEVKTQCLISLGGACHYAFSPNSEFKIPEQIRQKALEWAQQYLVQPDSKKAQTGAEVIKKLLEQDGFSSEQVDKYLGLLVERFNTIQPTDEQLATDLLKAMGTLCAQSVYKNQACRKFVSSFEKSLASESLLVRLAAADGLIYIDRARAFGLLKSNLLDDDNPVINQRLIELAGQVGGEQDLVWLARKSKNAGLTEPVWQAMVKIFRRSSFRTVNEWLDKFAKQDSPIALNTDQKLLLLEMAEQKGLDEGQTDAIGPIREQLAQIYTDLARYDKAAEYLGMLRQTAKNKQKKQDIIAKQIDVYLRWPNFPLAAQLIEYQLLEADIEPNSVIVRSIDGFFNKPPVGAEPNELLTTLSNIKLAEQKPAWTKQLNRWKSQITPAKTPETPKSD